MDSLKPRDRARYTDEILAVKCDRCGAPKNAPCISDTERKCELRSPHKPRRAAA